MKLKNTIIDFIILWHNGQILKEEMIQLIEYELGLREVIVMLVGETSDEFLSYIKEFDEEYILLYRGELIMTKGFEKLKTILKNIDNEHNLGLLLGYPKCCVKKWKSMKTGEETAIHKSTMDKYFRFLSYVPCSENCKESIERDVRLAKIILGKGSGFK